MSLTRRGVVAAGAALMAGRGARAAGEVEIRDIAGRTVKVKTPVERIVLGEGRLTYTLALLDREDPFRHVVGWKDDLRKTDPAGYRQYREKYPRIASLPEFSGFKEGSVEVEQTISLRPDVVVMNIEARVTMDESSLIQKLGAVGIPVVFVDFREKPFENTERSVAILGELLGRQDRAAAAVAFRRAQIDRVASRLAERRPAAPSVMVERAAGYDESCCMSFGDESFGRIVAVAGGRNIATGIIPGTFGTLNPEQVTASGPDVVIVTGSSWELLAPNGNWVPVGAGADMTEARRRLRALMDRPAYRTLPVTKSGRVHAIWHQFYDSPYQFVAIQQIAKWLHPDLFADVDADATFRDFHERFLPVPYLPGYWVSLAAA